MKIAKAMELCLIVSAMGMAGGCNAANWVGKQYSERLEPTPLYGPVDKPLTKNSPKSPSGDEATNITGCRVESAELDKAIPSEREQLFIAACKAYKTQMNIEGLLIGDDSKSLNDEEKKQQEAELQKQLKRMVVIGANLSNRECDTWLNELSHENITIELGAGVFNSLTAGLTSILGIAGAAPAYAGVTGVGSGFLNASFDKYRSTILFTPDFPALHKKINDAQRQAYAVLVDSPYPSYTSAVSALQNYDKLCSRDAIVTLMQDGVRRANVSGVTSGGKVAKSAKQAAVDLLAKAPFSVDAGIASAVVDAATDILSKGGTFKDAVAAATTAAQEFEKDPKKAAEIGIKTAYAVMYGAVAFPEKSAKDAVNALNAGVINSDNAADKAADIAAQNAPSLPSRVQPTPEQIQLEVLPSTPIQ